MVRAIASRFLGQHRIQAFVTPNPFARSIGAKQYTKPTPWRAPQNGASKDAPYVRSASKEF